MYSSGTVDAGAPMMRTALLVAVMLYPAALYAQAEPAAKSHGHRILTAVPRAWGRTLRNMVTWHDKLAAAQEWVQFAAVFADASSTNALLKAEPRAQEENPLLGHRPSAFHVDIEMGFFALNEASLTQWDHEMLDGYGKSYGLKWAPLAESVGLHGAAAGWNFSQLPQHTQPSGGGLK